MFYETAKKLKDAGFGVGKSNQFLYPEEGSLGLSRSQACYVPTHEELLYVLGDDFEALYYRRHNKTWAAADQRTMMGGFFSSIEALAHLWLVNNKKCEHNFIDAKNEVVSETSMCSKCGLLK